MSRFITGLFGSKNTSPPATALRVSSALQGQPVPILLGGRQRMAVNLIDYFGFSSNAPAPGGGGGGKGGSSGGKGSSNQTNYSVSFIAAVCEGPIAGYSSDWQNGTQLGITPAPDQFGGYYDAQPWDASLSFILSQNPTLTLIEIESAFHLGGNLQSLFPIVQSNHALAYRGIAYIAESNYLLGTSPVLPQMNMEVESFNRFNVVPGQPDGDASIAIIAFLTNPYWGVGFPTNRLGALGGYPSSYQQYCAALGLAVSPSLASPVTASSVISDLCEATNSAPCWQNGVLTIVPYGDQATTQGSIQQITETYIVPAPDANGNSHINVGNIGTFVQNISVQYFGGSTLVQTGGFPPGAAGIYYETGGTYWFYVGVGGDLGQTIQITYQYAAAASYVPDTTVLYDFTLDDFMTNQGTIGTGLGAGNSPVVIVRKPRDQMLNDIKVEYLDRNNAYNPVDLEVKDSASIFQFNRLRPSDVKQYHFFCLASAAAQSAALQLQRQQIARTFQWTVGAHFSMILQLMKVVTLTLDTMGMFRQPVRIIEIQENTDQTLTITAEEFPGTASAPIYGVEAAMGLQINYNADPGPVNTPLVFEPTDELGRSLVSGGGLLISLALSAPSSIWGGAQVWISYDNQQYTQIGTITTKARMGVLSSSLGGWPVNETGQSIDTLHTLAVDLTESGGSLASGSQLDATSLNLKCFVGPVLGQAGAGGGEVISYQTATLTAANKYNLTYLVRGAFGTEDEIAVWPAGTGFARIDDNIITFPFDKTRIGSTLFIKFVGFNIYTGGLQSLGAVSPYTYTVQGLALSSPLPTITNLVSAFVGGRLALTWDEIDDFRNGIRYEIRQGLSFDTAIVLGTFAHPPFVVPGTGTFWVTGWVQPAAGLIVRSEQPVSIDVAGAILLTNLVASFDCKANNWPGTFVNTEVDTSINAVRTLGAGVPRTDLVVSGVASAPSAPGTSSVQFVSTPQNINLGQEIVDGTDSSVLPIGTLVVDVTGTQVTFNNPINFDWGPDFPAADFGSRGILAGDTINFYPGEIIGFYTPPFTVNVGRVINTGITISFTGEGIPAGQNILTDQDILGTADILGAASTQFVDVEAEVLVSQDGSNYVAQKYVPGDYVGMSFKFRFDLSSFDLKTIAYLLTAQITVQVPTRIDHLLLNGTLLNTGRIFQFTPDGSSTPAPFNGGPNSSTVPYVVVTWGDEQPGDVLSITGLTQSTVTVQILNGGAGVTRNKVSVYAEGY